MHDQMSPSTHHTGLATQSSKTRVMAGVGRDSGDVWTIGDEAFGGSSWLVRLCLPTQTKDVGASEFGRCMSMLIVAPDLINVRARNVPMHVVRPARYRWIFIL
jgi:hypothetical protein